MSSRMLSCCSSSFTSLAMTMVLLTCHLIVLKAELQVGFYSFSCPLAELIIKDEVQKAFLFDNGVAAALLRLHFHDCFVRGCDGSVLIDSTLFNLAEKDSPPNQGKREFEVIDRAKARLESVCKGVVSCADILAFAARDSVEMTGGLTYDVPAGRRDGRTSSFLEALLNLPPPSSTLDQLTLRFALKGLTQEEMVTLSGAHTIGRAHCSSFSNRLYNFNLTTEQDPTLDPLYAALLKLKCPKGDNNPNRVAAMDPWSPAKTDVSYYSNLLANRGLFTSDQALLTSPFTAFLVTQNAQNDFLWKMKFAAAMVKMGKIDVLTGFAGEVRSNCRVIN
ncbi:PREDICTED: peroxidase 5-like [Ipomoea nil]|uniref:peroxidase 5-like n=1 Tax=Ipomoea nil TaxID=35883 RepID=UPI0009010A76|nr:PREDICTED: peroxidase 5-like [Ipomoea nil]